MAVVRRAENMWLHSVDTMQVVGTEANSIAIPLHVWTGPKASRRLRLQISRQSAYEGGKVVSLTYRPFLPPGNILILISVRG